MNKVVLIGRLIKDLELRFILGSGVVVIILILVVDKYNIKIG